MFVSEYAAPEGWESIWSRPVKGSLAAHTNAAEVTEHLFAWNSQRAPGISTRGSL